MQKEYQKNNSMLLFSFLNEDQWIQNCYLILSDAHMLIDLPSVHHYEDFKTFITLHTEIKQIKNIIIHEFRSTQLDILKTLIEQGFNGEIYTTHSIKNEIESFYKSIKVFDALEQKQTHNEFLQFIKLPFSPNSDMFMTLYLQMNALFSASLFSSKANESVAINVELHKSQMFKYHENAFPSSVFFKSIVQQLILNKPKSIYPKCGYQIQSMHIDIFLDFLVRLDFYNVFKSEQKEDFIKTDQDYIRILNHMLNKLHEHFSRIEILDTFIGTAFSLKAEPIEIKSSSLSNYKMYHRFFEIVYTKKGLKWILLLEPLVQKYFEIEHVLKPSMYQNIFVKAEAEKGALEVENQSLFLKINDLSRKMNQAEEQLTRCPITGLLNQDVFKQMTKTVLEVKEDKKQIDHYALISLDQLTKINQKYGKEIGDETLRHFAYQLNQLKNEDILLFKQNGPGVLACFPQSTYEQMSLCSLKVKNGIQDSNLFIEKMTSSIALVSSDEIDTSLSYESQIKQILNTLENRMAFAKTKGQGEIVDRYTVVPDKKEGLICLVDEDEMSQNMLIRIFDRINYGVKIAKSAKEAIEIIENNTIDVIVSEINISKMDGFQLKKALNESKIFNKIPFIMVSHNKTLENIKRSNLLDVDLILEKPIIPEELIGHIKRYKERMTAS